MRLRPSTAKMGPMSARTSAVGLTPALVVRSALDLMDEHGVEWLTMRRLASHLGVSAPTLYWHVKSRSELIDAAIDLALDGLATDPGDAPDWQTGMAEFMHTLRRHLTAHPCVTEMTKNRYPRSMHELTVRAVGTAWAMGLPPTQTAQTARLVIWQVIGFTTLENNIRLGTAYHEPLPADGTFSVTAPEGPEPTDDPAVDEHLAVLDLDELFDLDVRVFIAGLQRLHPGPGAAADEAL